MLGGDIVSVTSDPGIDIASRELRTVSDLHLWQLDFVRLYVIDAVRWIAVRPARFQAVRSDSMKCSVHESASMRSHKPFRSAALNTSFQDTVSIGVQSKLEYTGNMSQLD